MNIDQDLCEYLYYKHMGKENAASSKTLEAIFDISGKRIRDIVNTLRCKGVPICSDMLGYYYASTQHEINTTIAQLNSRMTKISNAKNGLLNSIVLKPDINIQISIKIS